MKRKQGSLMLTSCSLTPYNTSISWSLAHCTHFCRSRVGKLVRAFTFPYLTWVQFLPQDYMWVDCVGSLLCSKRFFSLGTHQNPKFYLISSNLVWFVVLISRTTVLNWVFMLHDYNYYNHYYHFIKVLIEILLGHVLLYFSYCCLNELWTLCLFEL